MYPVVVSESMSRLLTSFFTFFCRQGGERFLLLSACALILTGCGARSPELETPDTVGVEQDVVVEEARERFIFLPDDDGKPLSDAEREALLSEGELDRGVSSEDMRDVLLHFKSLVHGGGRITVEKNVERCQMYLPYIRKVLAEEKLPQELAYLAFIESGYNPLARSRTGALGMWQFISSTGKAYGMRQNWWLDERRDPYLATRAATAYLSRLHGMFEDWHLAITAYNAGEGKISRGLAATGAKTFFELRKRNTDIPNFKDRLTDENKQYLPRFLAVCKIMRNLEKLGFSRPDTSCVPQMARLEIKPGTDLLALSRSAGMSWKEFTTHNPAYRHSINHPGQTTTAYVVASGEAGARSYLRTAPGEKNTAWRLYTIARGDTMTRISRKTGVPVAELRRINQISEPLSAGKTLRIPRSARSAASGGMALVATTKKISSAKASPQTSRAVNKKKESKEVSGTRRGTKTTHAVVRGDTLYSIARAYDVDMSALKAANGLKDNKIKLGQQIRIPQSVTSPSGSSGTLASVKKNPAQKNTKRDSRIVRYEVRKGDSLWGIARKFNVSPTELLALNKMSRDVRLRPGDTVRVTVN